MGVSHGRGSFCKSCDAGQLELPGASLPQSLRTDRASADREDRPCCYAVLAIVVAANAVVAIAAISKIEEPGSTRE